MYNGQQYSQPMPAAVQNPYHHQQQQQQDDGSCRNCGGHVPAPAPAPAPSHNCVGDGRKCVSGHCPYKYRSDTSLHCSHGQTCCISTFFRQHSRDCELPIYIRNKDSQLISFSDSLNTVTDTTHQNEDLMFEPIHTNEIEPGNKCDVFKTRLNVTVKAEKVREWEEQKNCDIKITCGKFTTYAHNEVLSNVSDYFKANKKFNNHESNICLKEGIVSPDALIDVINFAYTGILEIGTERLQDIIATASYLQVTLVLDACEKGLINIVDNSSFMFLLPFAFRFDLTNLISAIILRLSENFETCVDQNALCSLSNDDLKFLFMNKNLSVFRKGIPVDNPELHIIEAIGKTLTANQVNDRSFVKDILSVIRFSEIPIINLGDLYNNYPAFQTMDESAFSNLKNNVLPKRNFSKVLKRLENSKAYAKNPHHKIPNQFKLVRFFEEISDISDRPRKVGLWITRWEGFTVIGGIRMEYKSKTIVLHGIRPKTNHSILSEHEFELDEDEVITNIDLRTGILLDSISFETNYGRTYGPYGSDAGYPSSSSPSQKRGYFHSFRGIVVKGRYDHYIANIECTWVVFKPHSTDYGRLLTESSKSKHLGHHVKTESVIQRSLSDETDIDFSSANSDYSCWVEFQEHTSPNKF
ncbi:uncharacterized protein LOC134701506 [Mytilus trossulus]|uniref:uncharacterized protein LOC134701506 n=1 Tax=Mytilus trossulus TaxID=6551 RepID=UPI00300519BB